jgi:hypothetical protein
MIADAFFSFLNWLRLLFFNREMELALIGGRIVYFYGEQCLFYILFPFFFFFFFFFFSNQGGLSRDERALLLEIASERMRARRGERSVRACFPLLVSKIKFSRKNSRGSIFGFFLLCEFFNLLTRAFFFLFVSSLTRAIARTQDYKTRGKRRS